MMISFRILFLLELSEFFLFGHYLPCTHDALLDCNNVKFISFCSAIALSDRARKPGDIMCIKTIFYLQSKFNKYEV